MGQIRILQTGLCEHYNGTESVIMNLYRHIDRSQFQFDFLFPHDMQAVDYEEEIKALGGKTYYEFYRTHERRTRNYISPAKFWSRHPEISGLHYNCNIYDHSMNYLAMSAFAYRKPIAVLHAHNTRDPSSGLSADIKHMVYQTFSAVYIKKLIACSTAAGKWMFGHHGYKVLPNAISTSKFAFNQDVRNRVRWQYGLNHKLVLGFVGRFVPQKNPLFLLEFLREVNKRRADAVLILIGEGELEGELRRGAAEMNLKNIIFMGHVDNVHEWMQAFDVFLLPSKFEGLGVVLIEAQASGLRCLASSYITKEAAVTNRITYLPISDPKIWADTIMTTDFSYDRSCGRDEVAAAGYDIRESAKRLEAIYDELLNQ